MRASESGDQVGLVERESDLAILDRACTAAGERHGSVVVVEGPAGVGITTLLDAASERFAVTTNVVRLRGSELEIELPFCSAVHLAERLASIGRSDVKGAAAHDLVDALLAAGSAPPEHLGLFHQALDVLRRTSAGSPLAVVVDDAQWLDQSSARLLAYVTNRLADAEVVVVVGISRYSESLPSDALARVRSTAATILSLEPLTADAIEGLLAAEGVAVPGAEVRSLTGGLPSLVAEVVRGLRDVAEPATAEDVQRLAIDASLRSMATRLERLDERVRKMLQAASLLGSVDPLMLTVLLGSSPNDVEQAAAPARALGILDGSDFAHPSVRRAVRRTVPRHLALRWHAAAADELLRRGARPEEAARHIAELPPQARPEHAEALMRAGRSALRLGAAADAVALLRRTLAEPPPSHLVPKAREQLMVALVQCDDPSWRAELATATAERPELEHRLLAAAGWTMHVQGRSTDAAPLLRKAWESVPDPASDTAIDLLTKLAVVSRVRVDGDPMIASALEAIESNLDVADRPANRALLAQLAYVRSLGDHPAASVINLAVRAFDPERVDVAELAHNPGLIPALLALTFVDGIDEFDELVTRVRAHAEHSGTLTLVGMLANVVAARLLIRGCACQAQAEGQRAVELLGLAEAATLPGAIGNLALATLETGDIDGAAAALHDPGFARWGHSSPYTAWMYARGRVRQAQGDHIGALEDFTEVGRRQEAMGVTNPTILPWWHDAAILHVSAGRLDEARRLVGTFRAQARRIGTVRAEALVDATEARIIAVSDPATAAVELDATLEALRQIAPGADLVRVLLDRAALARAAGERRLAGRLAQEAYDRAMSAGAGSAASRARAELETVGRRPRSTTSNGRLTPAEERVAALACAGLGNREIAAELFVSRKAVEFHLSNVYRKLGVEGRGALRSHFGS